MQPMMPPSTAGPLAPPKPKGRLAMVLGAILLVGGIVLGAVLAVSGVVDVSRAVDDYQRVAVPGGGPIEITETGTYHLFYERPPGMSDGTYLGVEALVITAPDGQQVGILRDNGTVTYDFGGRHGRSIGRFRADQVGTYQLRTVRADGETGFTFEPTGQIAVSRTSPLGSIGRVLLGVFGGGALVLAGITLLIIGGVRRSRSKQAAYVPAAGAVPGWGQPAPGGWTPPGPQPWTPPGQQPPAPGGWTPPGPQPWTPPAPADPPPPPGWVPPPAPPPDSPSWPGSSDGPAS